MKKIITSCPVCQKQLVVTALSCQDCGISVNGAFEVNSFSRLNSDELLFVESFLFNHGCFKFVQNEFGISYLKAKRTLESILLKLDPSKAVSNTKSMNNLNAVEINPADSLTVQKIKAKLNQHGGSTAVPLFRGEPCVIWFSADQLGLESDKMPIANQLTWEVFDAAVELLINNNGMALKGNARGGRLGSAKLPLDSLEGYIAYKVHGKEIGESVFSPGFAIAAILDWSGICNNRRGHITFKPSFISECNIKDKERKQKLRKAAMINTSRNYTSTEDIRDYIRKKMTSAKEHGLTYIDLKSGELHRELNLDNRIPMVCRAMVSLGNCSYEILHDTASGKSSSKLIRYFLK